MQPPTISRLRVRSTADAAVIFHAVHLKILPIVGRRLDNEERRAITSGCVYVWEERGPHSESTGLGIERWTDGIRWGPSRVRDEFLFYHEKGLDQGDMDLSSDSESIPFSTGPSQHYPRNTLIKQTYSVFVETAHGRRKWHMIVYFTQETLDHLYTVDDIPSLASIQVPEGTYQSARSAKGRPRDSRQASNNQTSRRSSPRTTNHYSVHGILSQANPVPQRAYSRNLSLSPGSDYNPGHHRHSVFSQPLSAVAQLHGVSNRYDATRVRRSSYSRGTMSAPEMLAPLEYLENITPQRRHPFDEQVLSFLSPRSLV